MSFHKESLKQAFISTMPLLAGFSFMGVAYGVYLNSAGFNFIFAFLMSSTIFSGSMEFLTVSLLSQSFNPLAVLILTLIINFRHIFYGISMLKNFEVRSLWKYYLIFGLCDQTFVINYNARLSPDVIKEKFMLYVTLLTHVYWVSGATIGGIIGSFFKVEIKGLDFVMTALFLVMFATQFMDEDHHVSSISGLIIALTSLLLFGKDFFLIATLIILVIQFSIIFRRSVSYNESD